jgi:hypothetical protein
MKPIINWHCPRPQMATNILDRYSLGFSPIVVLFAPRKSGKTEFVLKDVIPKAQENGYSCAITVDFWSDRSSPETCIIKAFSSAFNKLPAKLQAKGLKLKKITGGLSSTSSSLSFEGQAPLFESVLDATSVFEAIFDNEKNGFVFLFLDEVQHLATKESYQNITSTLRTFLNKNESWLHTIMTGSSQNGLQEMFKHTSAPFYGHGAIETYQPLGSEFISHMLHCYTQITHKSLNLKDATNTYRALARRPDKFRSLVERMITLGISNFGHAKDEMPELFEPESAKGWEDLSDDESLILQVVALIAIKKLPSSPYSNASKDYLKNESGEIFSKSRIQNALTKLKKHDWLINPSKGSWRFENETALRFVLVDILGESAEHLSEY